MQFWHDKYTTTYMKKTFPLLKSLQKTREILWFTTSTENVDSEHQKVSQCYIKTLLLNNDFRLGLGCMENSLDYLSGMGNLIPAQMEGSRQKHVTYLSQSVLSSRPNDSNMPNGIRLGVQLLSLTWHVGVRMDLVRPADSRSNSKATARITC